METARVAVIEFALDGDIVKGNLVVYECSNPVELQRYISSTQREDLGGEILRRIFLVEWSEGGPVIADAEEDTIRHILQTQIYVPADLFSEHASHGVGSCFEPREEHIINSYLITALSAEQRFCVSLFGLLEYTGRTEHLMMPCPLTQRMLVPGDAGLTLVCGDTERQLQFHQWRTREGWLIIAPMKCSYWSREHNGSWDVVVVVDPAPNTAKVLGIEDMEPISLRPRNPFLGGYHEFLPRDVSARGILSDVTTGTLRPAPEVVNNVGEENEAHHVIPPAAIDEAYDNGLSREPGNGSAVEMSPREDQAKRERKQLWKNAEERKRNILADLTKTVSPRTSLFDDLRYYFSRHSAVLASLASPHNSSLNDHHTQQQQPRLEPSSTTLFPLKLIASHYSLLHAFVSFQTASMRSTGWTLKDDTAEQMEESHQVEEAWSRFRCSEYLEALEALLDSLGITLYGMSGTIPSETTPLLGLHHTTTVQTPGWRSAVAPDFLFLHRQFTMRRQDYDRITTSIAALAGIIAGRVGIITGRVAVSEAKAAKSLSYVAMLFAPLAWVAAVYSMPDQFAPGGPLFWKYWATAVPFMLFVWLLITTWHNRKVVARRVGGARRSWMGGEGNV